MDKKYDEYDDGFFKENMMEEQSSDLLDNSKEIEEETEQRNFYQAPKPSKNKNRRVAMLVAVNLMFSAAVGFGGGMLAQRYAGGQNNVTLTTSPYQTMSAPTTAGTGISAMSVTDIATLAANSVVEIRTEIAATGNRLQQFVSEGAGSGVIISKDGYIVTNNHVIEGAQKITVRLRSGETYSATLVGTDAKTDIAVVKIEGVSGLQTAVFGNSDNLVVGELAVAIGNPLGELGGTVTDGIISALDREIEIDGTTMNLLQTNAAINPGNSGGGLFNERAELVGIVNAKSSGSDVEGLGFAIPANTAKEVAQKLIEHGYVTGRAKLGISVIDADSNMARTYNLPRAGLYVYQVESGSGAEKAGIKGQDYLVSVNGTKVSTTAELNSVLGKLSPGNTVPVVVSRNSQELTLNVTLSEVK